MLNFHHGSHVIEEGYGPAKVLQGVQIIGSVLGKKFDVVEHA